MKLKTLFIAISVLLLFCGSAMAGSIEAGAGTDVTVKMGDNAGSNKVSFTDSDDAEVASITSEGAYTGSLSTSIGLADVAFSDITGGDSYTNFGSASDDTINELFETIDNNFPTGSTDDQNISGSGLSGTTLTIGIEGGTNEDVELSSLQDGTGTDDQTAAEVTYDNTDSGLSATDVKAAVDEVDGRVDTLESKSVSNTPSDGSFDPVSTIEGTAGEALSFGDVVFSANNSGSHNWYAYEATTATDGHAFARGIVVESGGISSSATGTIMLEGTIQSTGWSMTSNQDEGSQVYASDTAAGGILTTAPADTDDIMQILGFVLEEDIIYFNPDYTTVVVP